MHVRATRMGYYGLNRYRVGQEFEIESEQAFSMKWMEKVGLARPERAGHVPDKEEQSPAHQARRRVI